jgi:quercetin dioxygenase-like cupin family protein
MQSRAPLLIAIAVIATLAMAQQSSQPTVVTNINDIKSWSVAPHVPECDKVVPMDGDVHGSSSVTLVKFNQGCTVPMHWHSSGEKLVIVSGTARIETQGNSPQTVKAGDYWSIPAHTYHQITCTTDCMFYRFNDGPVDLHYVDRAGNEIPADQALDAVNERPSSPVNAGK